jgi:hypothetical protein
MRMLGLQCSLLSVSLLLLLLSHSSTLVASPAMCPTPTRLAVHRHCLVVLSRAGQPRGAAGVRQDVALAAAAVEQRAPHALLLHRRGCRGQPHVKALERGQALQLGVVLQSAARQKKGQRSMPWSAHDLRVANNAAARASTMQHLETGTPHADRISTGEQAKIKERPCWVRVGSSRASRTLQAVFW